MNPESEICICVCISGGFGDLRRIKDSWFFWSQNFGFVFVARTGC